MEKFDVIVIGAGAVGCLTTRELTKYNLRVACLEKSNDVGNGTSSANSAIVHSGYDPLPGSNKAKFNVLGNKMFDQIADELDIHMNRIGSITVAFDEEQVKTLHDLEERAKENGVPTVFLDKEAVHKEEPMLNDNVVAGLLAPTAGIVDPFNLSVHAMENAIDNGATLKLKEEVKSIVKVNDKFIINDKYEASIVINCAGLYSDIVNKMINKDDDSFEILPRKGEYLILDHFTRPFVKHTLFMVPSAKGKGVLVSPTTSGNYLIGPSAELTTREDDSCDKPTLSDIKRQANEMVNNIPYYECIRVFAGVRATPSTHDFIIEESKTKGFINVAGIESPGLVSSPAIAKYVVEEIVGKITKLTKNDKFNPYVKKYTHTKEMSIEEKNELFKKDANFAKMVCKCERVTKGEVLEALNRSCPPHSVEGLKRRIRVGFGKCQGGMCQSDTLDIMANFYHVDKKDIPYDEDPSYILLCKTKEDK